MRNTLLLCSLFYASQALAFEPLNTDDAGTIGLGVNQIEAYFYTITAGGPNGEFSDISPGEEFVGSGNAKTFPITYTRGLSENIEASVSTSYYALPRGHFSPLSNYVLGLKWRFMGNDNSALSFAAKPTITLPTGNNQQIAGLGNAAVNYGLNMISSYNWESFAIHMNMSYEREPYNVNYSVAGDLGPQRKNVFAISIAPVWQIHSKLKLAADIGSGTNTPTTSPTYLNTYAMAAAIYSPISTVDIGLAYLTSGNNISDTVSSSKSKRNGSDRFEIGATWRF